jgi:hypothetical protein
MRYGFLAFIFNVVSSKIRSLEYCVGKEDQTGRSEVPLSF